jgi:predicted dinucleotide-binding enzyme
MAHGIATRALAGGHQVAITDKSHDKAKALADELGAHAAGASVAAVQASAVADAEIVVLAIAYQAATAFAGSAGAALSGKVLVDISNPIDFATFDSLVVPPGTSAAEQIAAAAPGARVVKAFNTTFAATLATGHVDGVPLDVFIAGDDPGARDQVAALAASGGLNPVDVGALKHARELEGIQLLNMALQRRDESYGWMSALKILKP